MSPETYRSPEGMYNLAYDLKPLLIAAEDEAQQAASMKREAVYAEIEKQYGTIGRSDSTLGGISDTRIRSSTTVISPEAFNRFLPVSDESAVTTLNAREASEKIISGEDDRLIVVPGPCSIHDIKGALEYAAFIKRARETYSSDLEILMRFYVEKPRTVTGWKGFTYDPELTEYFDPKNANPDINLGLILTRMLANRITHDGVPIATERLNPLTPQFVNKLITMDTVGARNALDQTSREYVSGTSSIAAIKNPVDGSIEGAVDALISASTPHAFLGISLHGNLAEVVSSGNDSCLVLLRGGRNKGNHQSDDIQRVKKEIEERAQKLGIHLNVAIGVDTSHMNSGNHYKEQPNVARDVVRQLMAGETAIKLVMIESNLVEGTQKIKSNYRAGAKKPTKQDLRYGQSITDGCVNLSTTTEMLGILAQGVRERRKVLASQSV